jgi:signal transduction histidine kinase
VPPDPSDDRRPPSAPGREASGELAEIASMISHELRGPITTIKGLASTIARYREQLPAEEQLEFLSMIERETGRLLEIADEVALTLRLDGGALEPTPRAIELSRLVQQALDLAPIEGRDVTARIDTGLTVRADPELAARAISHVIVNADRFSPPGEPVEIRGATEDGEAVLEIEDGGPGIPPERREEVFARFARWRPDGYEDRPGAGLGLFLSRGLLAASGARIDVDAGTGGGTIVRIHLPLEG